jgi:hypothetical protein
VAGPPGLHPADVRVGGAVRHGGLAVRLRLLLELRGGTRHAPAPAWRRCRSGCPGPRARLGHRRPSHESRSRPGPTGPRPGPGGGLLSLVGNFQFGRWLTRTRSRSQFAGARARRDRHMTAVSAVTAMTAVAPLARVARTALKVAPGDRRDRRDRRDPAVIATRAVIAETRRRCDRKSRHVGIEARPLSDTVPAGARGDRRDRRDRRDHSGTERWRSA